MAIINSPFEEFVSKIFPKLSLYVTEKTNNSNRELTYLHKQRLRTVYSPTQKWEGTSANTRLVAADMVAMDSPLPLKKRSTISKVSGDLPKMGIAKQMLESDMNAINIMRAEMNMIADTDANAALRKQKYQQILARFADDGYACSYGLDERNEYNYLYGISNGVVLVEDEDSKNTGVAMRVNYGYPEANLFGLINSEVCADDIENVVSKADAKGVTFASAMLSKTLLTNIRRTRWARELAADYKEQTYTDATKLPVPSVKTFTEAFENEYNISLIVVDRSILMEKNGKDASVKPFNPNRIIFLPNANTDGSLVWGTLAEATNPVDGVNYSTVEQYKLISRFRTNEPSLMEITKGQALVLPVIEDVEKIYVLDFTKGAKEPVAADTTDAGAVDASISIEGTAYQKAAVVAALNDLGDNIKASVTDATVIKHINALSDADYAKMMDAIQDKKYSAS